MGHRLLDGNRIERNPDQVVIGGSLLRRKSNGKRRPPIYSIKGGLLNDIDVKIEASARGRKRTRVELDWTFKIKEGTKMPQKGEWKPQRWSKCLTQRGTRSDVSSLPSLNPTEITWMTLNPFFSLAKVTKNKYSNAETQWDKSKERKVLHSMFVVQSQRHRQIR